MPAFVRGASQDKRSLFWFLASQQNHSGYKVAQHDLCARKPSERPDRIFLGAQSHPRKERKGYAADEDTKKLLVLGASGKDREVSRRLARLQAAETPSNPFNSDAQEAARGLTARSADNTDTMDPTSTVRTDALPAIATLVIPGASASISYVWLLLDSTPHLRAFLDAHDGIATLIAVLVAIAAGFAIESASSYVEVYLIDRRRSDHQQMLEIWWCYLRIAWNKEPIGQRYLRRLLTTFKFELKCLSRLCAQFRVY